MTTKLAPSNPTAPAPNLTGKSRFN